MASKDNAAADVTVPHSVEAEEALLGSVLIDPDQFDAVRDIVSAEDFYIVRHGWIWHAMLTLKDRGDEIDYVSLSAELGAMGKGEECPPTFLTYLLNHTPAGIYAETYAHIIKRAALRRRLLVAASEIARLAYSEDKDVFGVIEQSYRALDKVTETAPTSRLQSLYDGASEYLSKIDDDTGVIIRTGFADVDRILGGLHGGDFAIVAARPRMGKTALLLTVITSVAATLKETRSGVVLHATMEMDAGQIVERLVAMETGIPVTRLRGKELDDQEMIQVVDALQKISELPIVFDDRPTLTPLQLRASVAEASRRFAPVRLITVDYAQLMSVESDMQRALAHNDVSVHSYISRALKELARSANIPVLVAAQLNRQVEYRRDKRPMLSDLRSSGTYEQDADLVMFLYRAEVYDPTDSPNEAELNIAKYRHGGTGVVSLYFEKERMRFANLARQSVPLTTMIDIASSWKPYRDPARNDMEHNGDDN